MKKAIDKGEAIRRLINSTDKSYWSLAIVIFSKDLLSFSTTRELFKENSTKCDGKTDLSTRTQNLLKNLDLKEF